MEDRDMKKEYIKPAMLLVLMNTRQQMLAGSVTNVTTNLDPVTPINYDPTDAGVDPWGEAQSREMTFDEEEEDDFEDDIV